MLPQTNIRAVAFDAFGTLIRYGSARFNPYRRLLYGRRSHCERLPLLTRNVPAATFASELGLEHMKVDFERELSEELEGLRLFSEVPEVLRQARDAGLRLAVCSNLAMEYGMAVRNLLPDLDAYVFSYEVGAAKPDTAIYTATCVALDCPPDEVIFVGDSYSCDFKSPQAFGMQARWLDRTCGQTLLDALEGFLCR